MDNIVYTLSEYQINYLQSLFDAAYMPAKVKVTNIGICDGKMIVGYIKYGEQKTVSVNREYDGKETEIAPFNKI